MLKKRPEGEEPKQEEDSKPETSVEAVADNVASLSVKDIETEGKAASPKPERYVLCGVVWCFYIAYAPPCHSLIYDL